MKVGLLGLQGAFRDHIRHLSVLGVDYTVVKSPEQLGLIDRLIIPGGESTVMRKYLEYFLIEKPLRRLVAEGMPVWGICAGSILLAETVNGADGAICALPVNAERNAYGRQMESSIAEIDIHLLQRKNFPAYFIRAPRLRPKGNRLQIHSIFGTDPVFVQHGSVMATTFHPELTDDPVFHDYFLQL
ncbi:MAG TPA: pyridoxal 5'-phosphate synthase glutaminase subunit PdxT [Desulfobacteraceae bacterium]|nr:pyridoxal 5'-phosphate synthase glutaminase subunit PdxT [Desulfobacteraceae bacterium]